jgi:putative NIF3 family GTP cyclohydrolase 1 type 2
MCQLNLVRMKILFGLSVCLFPLFLRGQNSSASTARQLIETIIKNTGSAPVLNTVDIIKEGNPETKVTGIVTCMFATMDVLKKAVEKKCNLIIVHEPLYYNHLDNTEKFKNDSVFLMKKKFINDNQLVIWRFHDYIHRIQSDGIMTGMVEKLGWEKNKVEGNAYKFSFPQITLLELLNNIKKAFPQNTVNIVGDRAMKVSGAMFVPGASGTDAHIRALRDNEVQVVVAGEVPQWETYEYVRDAVTQGKRKAIVFIGHINSEESGMKFCADWLKKFIMDIPINYVECGSSYWTY